MNKRAHITYGDILDVTGKPVPEDSYSAQLLEGFKALMQGIVSREGKSRYFTDEEITHVNRCLAGYNGNPTSFSFLAEQRRNPDEELPFVTQPLSPFYDRVLVGEFDEQAAQFKSQPWFPTDDSRLKVSFVDQGTYRHWKFRIPAGYPLSIVLGKYQGEQQPSCYTVMYRPPVNGQSSDKGQESEIRGTLVIAVRSDFLETPLEPLLLRNDVRLQPLKESICELTLFGVQGEPLEDLDAVYEQLTVHPLHQLLFERIRRHCMVYHITFPLRNEHILYIQAADLRDSFIAPAFPKSFSS